MLFRSSVDEFTTLVQNEEHLNVKKRCAQLRFKITRAINRIKKFMDQGTEMRKRIEREII